MFTIDKETALHIVAVLELWTDISNADDSTDQRVIIDAMKLNARYKALKHNSSFSEAAQQAKCEFLMSLQQSITSNKQGCPEDHDEHYPATCPNCGQ